MYMHTHAHTLSLSLIMSWLLLCNRGQTLPKVFESAFGDGYLADRHVVITIMTLFLMIPLSMNKVCLAKAKDKTRGGGKLISCVVCVCVCLSLLPSLS